MLGYRVANYGGFAKGCAAEAEVTMCKIGVRGWYVRSTYKRCDLGHDIIGVSEECETLESAEEAFDDAKSLAEKWWKKNDITYREPREKEISA